MNIIIVGGGKVGLTIADYLTDEDHDISVIDPDASVIEYVSNKYDVIAIQGSGMSVDDLEKAGADKADLIVATASDDEINILSCVIAKKIGTKYCIARVRNPEHSKQIPFMRDELGIDMTVNPESYAANEISRIIRMPSAIKIDSFAKGRIDMAEIKVKNVGVFDGLALSMLSERIKSKVLVCAVARDDEVFIPKGDFIIKGGDRLHVTASHENLSSFFKLHDMVLHRIKDVIIIGGGRIAYYLTRQLLEIGISVKIIENDRERSIELSRSLPKAKIIRADGTDQDILLSEDISDAGACVALTGIDEENIIISMFAKLQGTGKVITKINKITLKKMTESVGLDSIISPKLLTANMIVQYVRALQNTKGSNISTLYKLVDDKVEAIEFVARKTSSTLKIPFRELKLKKNLLISGIIRGGKVIIPSGDDWIEAGDSVIVVTTNMFLHDLDEILL